MEKIFVTIVLLYSLFVAICFLRLRAGKRRKKNIVGQGSVLSGTERLKPDIIGKSAFIPLVPPKKELLPIEEKKLSAEVPPEELDDVFSETPPPGEMNEPMEDVTEPFEYEQERAIDDPEPDEEEEETEEIEGAAQAALASGVPFEDLGNAIRTVNKTDEATAVQRLRAGDTLLGIRKTDMFEQLVSQKPDAQKIVTRLMAESMAEFYLRKDSEAGTVRDDKKAPESFDMRDFI